MVVHSICILPHGTMILDLESRFAKENLPDSARELNQACYSCVDHLFAIEPPDYIFLVTPHGLALKDKIGLYANSQYRGSAEWNGHWSEYAFSGCGDIELAKELNEYIHKHFQDIELITSFSLGSSAPLAWGEVVPLYFCSECQHIRNTNMPKIIIFSLPTERYLDPVSFGMKAKSFGESIAGYVSSSTSKIAIMISADLSHVHAIEGDVHDIFRSPDSSLQPNSSVAIAFDQLIVQWSRKLFEDRNVGESAELLTNALSMAMEAKSCGIGGCCITQSIFEALQRINSCCKWHGKQEYYAAPTYYGMIVVWAVFDG